MEKNRYSYSKAPTSYKTEFPRSHSEKSHRKEFPGPTNASFDTVTHSQRKILEDIHIQDREIDRDLQYLGDGMENLKALAKAQNEEVKLQNSIIDPVVNETEAATDKVREVHRQLKTGMKKHRRVDQICIDVLCFLFTLVLLFVLYLVTRN